MAESGVDLFMTSLERFPEGHRSRSPISKYLTCITHYNLRHFISIMVSVYFIQYTYIYIEIFALIYCMLWMRILPLDTTKNLKVLHVQLKLLHAM